MIKWARYWKHFKNNALLYLQSQAFLNCTHCYSWLAALFVSCGRPEIRLPRLPEWVYCKAPGRPIHTQRSLSFSKSGVCWKNSALDWQLWESFVIPNRCGRVSSRRAAHQLTLTSSSFYWRRINSCKLHNLANILEPEQKVVNGRFLSGHE